MSAPSIAGAEGTRSAARGVADDLRRRILDGEFVTGSRLPSEQALAEAYSVSRAAIRTALATVARRGLVESQRGAGWFVRLVDQVQAFDRLRPFAEWAQGRGMQPGGSIIECEHGAAGAREARLLRVALGERLLRFTRLRTLGSRVVMIERSTWAPWVTSIIEALPPDVTSVTRELEAAGIHLALGTHRIFAVPASTQDAHLLGVRRSSPLLAVQRSTYSRDGRAVEFGEDRYLPGDFAFEVTAAP